MAAGADPPTAVVQYNTFVFEAGDIQIRVTYTNQALVGNVCSQALIQASSAWKVF